jgi:hypothetical protein
LIREKIPNSHLPDGLQGLLRETIQTDEVVQRLFRTQILLCHPEREMIIAGDHSLQQGKI